MGTVTKWSAPTTIASALTTELNSLGNGSFSNASSGIDNATDKHKYIDLELNLASLTPSGVPYVAVYAVYSVDGTNYEDGGGATAPPAMSQIAQFDLSTSTGAKLRTRVNTPIGPFLFKLIAENRAGVAFGASGNTLEYRLHSDDTP